MSKKIKKETLADTITTNLRKKIVKGDLVAGQQLKQEELAAHYNVSMSSLREALRSLEACGLVTIKPRRGATVSALSVEEAEEIYDIRTYLELGALEIAIPKITDKDIKSAEKHFMELGEMKDPTQWPDINWKFHIHLYAPSQREKLLTLIKQLHDNVSRYMIIYLDTMKYQKNSQEEHLALLKACADKDLKTAQATLRGHMFGAKSRLVQYLKDIDNS